MKRPLILVTGANGFIGRHLCQKLVRKGYSIIALTRSQNPIQLRQLVKRREVTIEVGDITSVSFLKDLFGSHEIEVVFHLAIESEYSKAGKVGSRLIDQQSNIFRTNVAGTHNLLQRALESRISAFIHSSSMSVYNYENPDYLPVNEQHPTKPINFYGLTKLLSEEICQYYHRSTALKCVILRYAGVFGPGKNRGIIDRLVNGRFRSDYQPIDVEINRSSDFVYVADVVNVNILAMEKLLDGSYDPKADPNVFNIGSGMETSMKELADLIMKVAKAQIKINPTNAPRPRRFYYDISAAKKFLNYSPRDIYSALEDYVGEAKAEGVGIAD